MKSTHSWMAEFVLLWITALLFWVAVFAQNATLTLYLTDRGLLPHLIGWLVGVAGLAALGGRLVAGWTIQRWTTRPVMLVGGLLWAMTIPVILWGESTGWLLLARMGQGLALALFTSASAGHVALAIPDERRGSALGWWGLANSLAGALSPALAAWLAGGVGLDAALLAGGLSGALAGLLGLVGPRRAQSGGPSGGRLGLSRGAMLPGLLSGSIGFAAGAYIAFVPLLAGQQGLANPGLPLSLFAVGTAASRLVAGPASDRWGRGVAIWPGLLLAAVAMALQGLAGSPAEALAVPLLFGLGAGAAIPALMAWAVDRSAPADRAVAPSTFYAFYEGGMFLGPALVGGLLSHGLLPAFGLPALLAAAAAATYLAAGARRPDRTVSTTF